MTDLRKAAEMALERLESHEYWMDEEAIQALRQALAQPEQKGHCTCGDPETLGVVHFRTRPCIYYTAPPKREWKGLTSDDKHFLLANAWNKEQAFDGFMDAIDKFLEEKNT